jgi:hypothetical protein
LTNTQFYTYITTFTIKIQTLIGFSCNFLPLGSGQNLCSSSTAFLPTNFSALDGLLASRIISSILDLSGGDIDNQLSEPDRVARAFETTGCHYTWISLIRRTMAAAFASWPRTVLMRGPSNIRADG